MSNLTDPQIHPLYLTRSWQAVSALFFLNGAFFGAWASRIPAIAERFSLNHATLGLMLLALAFGAIASFPVAGTLIQRLGAAYLTGRIAIAYAVAFVVIALAPTPVSLVVAIIFFGATHGAMDVAMNAWAGEVERDLKRPAMSGFHAMFSLGAGLGAATGFVAVRLDAGLFTQFATVALTLSVATLMISNILASPRSRDVSDKPSHSLIAIPRGSLLMVGLIAFGASMGEGAIADWSSIFLVTVANSDAATAALGYAVFSIMMVVFRLTGDRIVSRAGAVATVRFSAMAAISGILLAVAGATPVLTLIGFALMGAGYAIVMPLVFSRAANDKVIAPGPAIAGVATLGYGGMLAGPPVIGFLAEIIGLRMAFGLLGCLALMSALLAGHLRIANKD